MQEIARLEGVPPKHVGKDGDAVAGRSTRFDRLDDVASTQIRIVIGTDRDGFDLFFADP